MKVITSDPVTGNVSGLKQLEMTKKLVRDYAVVGASCFPQPYLHSSRLPPNSFLNNFQPAMP